jgi:serine protease Do
MLKPVVDAIMAGKKVDQKPKDATADLAMISDKDLTAKYGLTMVPNVVERTPAFVDDVAKDSLSGKSGLQRGDLIVLVEDAVITSITDFQQQLANFRTGQRLSLTINRDEELKTVELRIP